MSEITYRMYIDGEAATQEQLDRFEDITVEQEVDKAWEARLQMPMCLNEQGQWTAEDESFVQSFTRIRLEIKVADDWVALIDGPVVGNDSQMNAEPGQSQMIVMVHDDSVFLNQQEVEEDFDDETDDQMAEALFGLVDQITAIETESVSPGPDQRASGRTRRGTAIRILRTLARRYNKHAYVWPGNEPGQSIGCFKSFPEEVDEALPPIITIGENRNARSFSVQNTAQQPANYTTSRISLDDKGITTETSSFRDATLMGSQDPYPDESQTGTRRLSQYADEGVDLREAVQARSNASLHTYEGSGSVNGACYLGVLRPYRMVTIQAGQTRLSGNYVLTKVTHKFTRSAYTQNFTAKRNAASDASAGSNGGLGGELSASVNVSISIF